MIIKLNKKQFDYLNDSLFENREYLKLKIQTIKQYQYILMNLDGATADKIRDWASNELQKKGFDINYELTDEGKMLESLIDIFYVE